MAVRIVEVTAKREGSKLTTISEKEIGTRENEDFNWRPLCELIIKEMVRLPIWRLSLIINKQSP